MYQKVTYSTIKFYKILNSINKYVNKWVKSSEHEKSSETDKSDESDKFGESDKSGESDIHT